MTLLTKPLTGFMLPLYCKMELKKKRELASAFVDYHTGNYQHNRSLLSKSLLLDNDSNTDGHAVPGRRM